MSSAISRFTLSSTPSKSISRFPASNPSHNYIAFNPIPMISILNNKEIACSFHGRSIRSLQRKPLIDFVVRSNVTPPPAGAPLPSGSPSGSLRNWIVGIVITFVLPFFTHKWGPLILIKNRVDTVMDTAEHIMEAIEVVAEKVDKVVEDIADDLPEGSKLRKAMDMVEDLAEGVAKGAHVANDIIDKVEEAEDKLESLMIHQEAKEKKKISQETSDEKKDVEEVTSQEASDQQVD